MTNKMNLSTNIKNTWCPGCGNFAILNSIKIILGVLYDEGIPLENLLHYCLLQTIQGRLSFESTHNYPK